MSYYYIKTTTTKNRLYVWRYSYPVYYGFPKTARQLETYEKKLEGTKQGNSLYRSQMNAKLLVETNYTPYMKFLTLTYANAAAGREQVVKDFNAFAKRYKRDFGYKLKYLYTMERANKKGSYIDDNGKKRTYTNRWHVHAVLFHERFIPVRDLKRTWGHGKVKINAVDDPINIGLYLVKYITKDAVALNKKGYISSLGLTQPHIERSPNALDFDKSLFDFYTTYSRKFIDKQGIERTQVAELFEISLIK